MNIFKYFNIIIFSLLMLCNFNVVNSAEPIVYIDLPKLMKVSLVGQSLSKKLKEYKDLNSAKFKKKLETLKSKEKKIIAQKNVLAPADFQQKIKDLKIPGRIFTKYYGKAKAFEIYKKETA